jgi:hypothetical protein
MMQENELLNQNFGNKYNIDPDNSATKSFGGFPYSPYAFNNYVKTPIVSAAIGSDNQAVMSNTVSNASWIKDKAEQMNIITAAAPVNKTMVGVWDSWNTPNELDMWKDYASRIDTSKKNLIVQIGNFTKGRSETDIRNRIKRRLVNGDILFYLLDDEPFLGSGSLSAKYWNGINDIASTFNIPFGWSLSDNKVKNFDFYSAHEMIIPINTYLFFQENYGGAGVWGNMRIETREQFMNEVERVFNIARKKLPNSQFIFVAQGFSDARKYRKPPIASVKWTYDFVDANEDVIGVLWYEWSNRTGLGLKSMPKFYEEVRKYSINFSMKNSQD